MSDILAESRPKGGESGRFRGSLMTPEGHENDSDSGWLLIYLDVMTLLLVLFIVLLAFADPDPETRPTLPDSLMPPLIAAPAAPTEVPLGDETETDEPERMETPDEDIPSDRVEVIEESDRVSLRIQDSLLFQSGQASLTQEGLALLDDLVSVLQAHDGAISVEGHTDNVPIATDAFPSNWELSTARATEVLRYLSDGGVAENQLRAVGRADTDPVAPNTNAPGRAATRRVDIILHRTDDP